MDNFRNWDRLWNVNSLVDHFDYRRFIMFLIRVSSISSRGISYGQSAQKHHESRSVHLLRGKSVSVVRKKVVSSQ